MTRESCRPPPRYVSMPSRKRAMHFAARHTAWWIFILCTIARSCACLAWKSMYSRCSRRLITPRGHFKSPVACNSSASAPVHWRWFGNDAASDEWWGCLPARAAARGICWWLTAFYIDVFKAKCKYFVTLHASASGRGRFMKSYRHQALSKSLLMTMRYVSAARIGIKAPAVALPYYNIIFDVARWFEIFYEACRWRCRLVMALYRSSFLTGPARK